MQIFPPPTGEMKLSCFSAVKPVIGRNQCVKCVAPRSSAQTFMPSAMAPATSSVSGLPSRRQARHAFIAASSTYWLMASSLNT